MLRHTETLVYFDGPQLMVATDPIGTKYLCMLAEQTGEQAAFLCAPISEARLARFEEGELDLLEAFRNPEIDELYIGNFEPSENGLSLVIESIQEVPGQWYPNEGFFLTYPPVENLI